MVTQYPLQCHRKNSEEMANNCGQSFGRFPRSSPTFAPTMICCFCIKIYAILEYHTCYWSISIFFSQKKKIPSQKNRSRLYWWPRLYESSFKLIFLFWINSDPGFSNGPVGHLGAPYLLTPIVQGSANTSWSCCHGDAVLVFKTISSPPSVVNVVPRVHPHECRVHTHSCIYCTVLNIICDDLALSSTPCGVGAASLPSSHVHKCPSHLVS